MFTLNRRGRTVVAIRAHRDGPDVRRLHQALLAAFTSADIYVIVDQTRTQGAWPSDLQTICFDNASLEASGLRTKGLKAGWQCGDYAYYALAAEVDFDFAWLIEPDVHFALDVKEFFAAARQSRADLLGNSLRTAEPTWYWTAAGEALGFDEVRAMFFPLTRLSRAAVANLLEHRRRISGEIVASAASAFPNDEVFVATVVHGTGLTSVGLEDLFPDVFRFFLHRRPLLIPDGLSRIHQPAVLHPAMTIDELETWLRSPAIAPRDPSDGRFWLRVARSLATADPAAQAQIAAIVDDVVGSKTISLG